MGGPELMELGEASTHYEPAYRRFSIVCTATVFFCIAPKNGITRITDKGGDTRIGDVIRPHEGED
jgi:hypothetical protein